MPSMVHAPMMNSVGYMLKEKTGDAVVSAFTAVNGRSSPSSPRRLNGANGNGMTVDTNHVRPLSRQSPEHSQEQKAPLPRRDEWASAPRVSENIQQNGQQNGHHSVSPSLSDQDRSPRSPGKRKRSSSEEDNRSYHSPDGTSVPSRPRLDSYVPKDDSPPNANMEHSQQRTLPPIDRADHDRGWQRRESHDMPHSNYSNDHHGDSRDMETSPDSMNNYSGMVNSDGVEMTRAGVQVDPKKRKRQFANRTKTGCGTCRRRKKKCDEAKPECINCTRGGFICEGYANKIPWPKNGPTKSHPPLQAKDRFPTDPQGHLYHNHGSTREGYTDPNSQSIGEGNRARPIVVDEHPQPARNGWGSGWGEPPRASFTEHQTHTPAEYPHPVASTVNGRPPSNDHHAQHPSQVPPSQRQHNPRIYHHTPQTMSQVVGTSPVTTAEAALQHHSQSQSQSQSQPPSQPQPQPQHPAQQPSQQQPHSQASQQQPQQLAQHPPHQVRHQSHQPHHQHSIHQSPQTSKPPGPPPTHYAPPPPRPREKSEKEKMLSGEPFLPYHPQLVDERERCKGAIFRFNNSSNPAVEIASDERMRHFRSILAARWVQGPQFRGHSNSGSGHHMPVTGHCGPDVFVDTPFMCDYGYNISIGERVAIGSSCKFLDSGRITIGRNTEIGAGVTIDTRVVPQDFKVMKGTRGQSVCKEVHIGENVYIGANATICAGVKIGTGAIIHPGSIVVRDIPRDVVVRGKSAEVRMVHWDED